MSDTQKTASDQDKPQQRKASTTSQHDEIPPVWSTPEEGEMQSDKKQSPAKEASITDKDKLQGEEKQEAESTPKPTDPMASLPEGWAPLPVHLRKRMSSPHSPGPFQNVRPQRVQAPLLQREHPRRGHPAPVGEVRPGALQRVALRVQVPRGARPDVHVCQPHRRSRMFQRVEKLAKNAFASMCLFGSNHDSTISGVWIWRGKQLAFELSPDWQVDYESYEWRKLDPMAKEEDKKLVDQYLLQENGNFGADKKPFDQCKIFK